MRCIQRRTYMSPKETVSLKTPHSRFPNCTSTHFLISFSSLSNFVFGLYISSGTPCAVLTTSQQPPIPLASHLRRQEPKIKNQSPCPTDMPRLSAAVAVAVAVVHHQHDMHHHLQMRLTQRIQEDRQKLQNLTPTKTYRYFLHSMT